MRCHYAKEERNVHQLVAAKLDNSYTFMLLTWQAKDGKVYIALVILLMYYLCMYAPASTTHIEVLTILVLVCTEVILLYRYNIIMYKSMILVVIFIIFSNVTEE